MAADQEHHRDRHRRQEDEAGQVAALDCGLAQHDVAHGPGLAGEPLVDLRLAAERLHHLDPDDALVGRLGDVGRLLLRLSRDRDHEVREAPREERDQRHHEAGAEREQRVHERQHDRDADDHHRALDRLHDAPADEVPHRVEVVRGARQHLARGVPVVEPPRVRQVGVVHHRAQPRLDPDADDAGRPAADDVDREPDRRQADHQRHQPRQRIHVVGHDRLVDDLLDQAGDREREARDQEGAQDRERDEASLLAPEHGELPYRRPERLVGRIDVGGHAPAAYKRRGWRAAPLSRPPRSPALAHLGDPEDSGVQAVAPFPSPPTGRPVLIMPGPWRATAKRVALCRETRTETVYAAFRARDTSSRPITLQSASITAGSNCVPALRRSSSIASAIGRPRR